MLLRVWKPGIDAWYASRHGVRVPRNTEYQMTGAPGHIQRYLRMLLPRETCFIVLIMGGSPLILKEFIVLISWPGEEEYSSVCSADRILIRESVTYRNHAC